MFGFHGSLVMWIGLAILLTATAFVRNSLSFPLPVGAALGLLSHLTVFRIKRWKECRTCKICEKTCEWARFKALSSSRANVRCDDCERSTWTRRSARTGSSSSGEATSNRASFRHTQRCR
jgi:hypothetical protein